MNTPVLSHSRLAIFRSHAGAFTSIELLAVIAVLVVLAAIALPALARSREKDVRVVCVNNEKQLYTSLQLYCDDNADRLPQLVGAGSWAFDIPTSITAAMTNLGSLKKTFYCPSTEPRFTDQQNWAGANSLWNFGGSSFNTVGYTFAFGGSASRIAAQYQNLTLLGELHTNFTGIPTIVADTPRTREIIADVMLSTGNFLPATAADNFSSIAGGYTLNGVPFANLSAHLGKGQLPAGGNIAFNDGHVQWRNFNLLNPLAPA